MRAAGTLGNPQKVRAGEVVTPLSLATAVPRRGALAAEAASDRAGLAATSMSTVMTCTSTVDRGVKLPNATGVEAEEAALLALALVASPACSVSSSVPATCGGPTVSR